MLLLITFDQFLTILSYEARLPLVGEWLFYEARTGLRELASCRRERLTHRKVREGGQLMAWRLEGTYFENCPCDMVCPCITSAYTMPADAERCLTVLAFHFDSGEIEGVDVSGLSVAMLVDTPPIMADGNWRVGMFMDASASQEQAD